MIDEARLEAFVHRCTIDIGAVVHAATVVVGDRLDLYRALADIGPTDATTLAHATECDRQLVRGWLDAQVASGYCQFSGQTGTYWLSPEQAAVLAEPSNPVYLVGAMTVAISAANNANEVCSAFKKMTGERENDDRN